MDDESAAFLFNIKPEGMFLRPFGILFRSFLPKAVAFQKAVVYNLFCLLSDFDRLFAAFIGSQVDYFFLGKR